MGIWDIYGTDRIIDTFWGHPPNRDLRSAQRIPVTYNIQWWTENKATGSTPKSATSMAGVNHIIRAFCCCCMLLLKLHVFSGIDGDDDTQRPVTPKHGLQRLFGRRRNCCRNRPTCRSPSWESLLWHGGARCVTTCHNTDGQKSLRIWSFNFLGWTILNHFLFWLFFQENKQNLLYLTVPKIEQRLDLLRPSMCRYPC